MENLMSTKEVATFLNVNEKMVYTLVAEKNLPATKITGKWLFPKHLVEQWIEANTTNFPQAVQKLPPYHGLLIIAGSNDLLLDKAISLFNGKDLAGWSHYLVESDVKMADVWSVRDGLMICKGEPMGYLATKRKFTNFRLVVEWRWAPGKPAGNSGVLLRITGKPMALPRCVEAQLKNGSAGDIWAFQGYQAKGDAEQAAAWTESD